MKTEELPALPRLESESVEFVSTADYERLAQTACGMLNAYGGLILAGYSDEGEVIGLGDPAGEVADRVRAKLAEFIVPRESYQITPVEADGRATLLIEVPEGARKPYVAKGSVYIRKGANNHVADPADLSRMIGQRVQAEERWERRAFVDVAPEALDAERVQQAASAAKAIGIHAAGNSLQDSLGALDLIAEGWPSGAAVALFATERTARHRLPQARVQFASFEDESLTTMLDRAEEVGGVIQIIERVFGLLRSRLHTPAKLPTGGLQREDATSYPLPAVREALVNAVMHRDYEDRGPVRISLFPNRLEVWNPGHLPEAYLGDPNARLISRPRNPDIARVLNVTGYAETMGIGLWQIHRQMLDAGLPEPKWTNLGGGVLLTLQNREGARTKAGSAEHLSERLIDFIVQTAPGEHITTAEYRQRFAKNLSERAARNDVRLLTELGFLEQQGRGYRTVYVRTSKPNEDG